MTDNIITLPNVSPDRAAQLATQASKRSIRRYTVELDLPPEKWALLERIARESDCRTVPAAIAGMVGACLDAAAHVMEGEKSDGR